MRRKKGEPPELSQPKIVGTHWNRITSLIETEIEPIKTAKNGGDDVIDRSEKLLKAVEEGVKHL
jgi:hypothetical protein